MNDENMKELLQYYFEEAYQIITQLESSVLELEKNPSNAETINEIFRAVHTLKGSSASMEFKEIADFSHSIEDSFDYLRGLKDIKLNSEVIDILLESIDILKQMIELRNEGKYFDSGIKEIEQKVLSIPEIISSNSGKTEKKKEENKVDTISSKPEIKILPSELQIFKNQTKPGFNLYKIIVEFNENDPMATIGPLQVYSSLRDLAIILKTNPTLEQMNLDQFYKYTIYLLLSDKSIDSIKKFINVPDIINNIDTEVLNFNDLENHIEKEEKENLSTINENPLPSNIEAQEKTAAEDTQEKDTEHQQTNRKNEIKEQNVKASTILRVDSQRIDELLNLVSQIVINKAALIEYSSKITNNIISFDNISSDAAGLISYLTTLADTQEDKIEISKNQVIHILNLLNYSNNIVDSIKTSTNLLSNELQVYSRTINLLQEGVMKIRMVPIEQMLTRFPRIIRDLSKKLNKDVEMIAEGSDTELDKSIIEELTDPVMHILRNCMDHGIEDANIRERLGKKRKGTIKIIAKNEGNIIKISIEDDGAGIDPEKVRKKAIQKNLISETKILSLQDIYNLLFTPGFSTAEKISDVSGRGVGLDVVKKSLENLNGTVQIESEIGKFTRFTIKIPLTLAIIQALLVYVSNEIYAIPINNIYETKRIYENEILQIEGKDAIKIRNEYVSVIYLNEVFNLKKDVSKDFNYLVIVGVGDKKVGLVIDSLIGSQDIVIKPLKNAFTRVPSIAGSAILGNGAIALIIDVNQMVSNETRADISEVDIK